MRQGIGGGPTTDQAGIPRTHLVRSPRSRSPRATLGAQRRASCRRRSADGPGQRDLGGMDPRPPGAASAGWRAALGGRGVLGNGRSTAILPAVVTLAGSTQRRGRNPPGLGAEPLRSAGPHTGERQCPGGDSVDPQSKTFTTLDDAAAKSAAAGVGKDRHIITSERRRWLPNTANQNTLRLTMRNENT
jgi:hypothetical protein